MPSGVGVQLPPFAKKAVDMALLYGSIKLMIVGERSSVVEHHVANVMVVGSNPIARSIFFSCLRLRKKTSLADVRQQVTDNIYDILKKLTDK